ncbi:MAG TPA: hypothetical protein VJR89_07535 [Polyangiales bacterium]|nr:hypothetical protein [Polyangiales bacterium]
MRMRLCALGLLCLAASGCMQTRTRVRMAYLKVEADPPGTTVYNGDHFIGTARILAKQPKALPPGVKYLTFKANGYFPHDLKLKLPEGDTTVKIKLRAVPP